MKKLLFSLLSLAVATSVMAGNFKQTHLLNHGKEMSLKVDKTKKAPRISEAMNFSTKAAMLKAPVTEQPEGELKSYIRSGQYDYAQSGYLYCADQSGKVDIVFGSNNEVYLKDILCGTASYFSTHSWVSGTYDENTGTISVPLNQSIAYVDTYNADILLCWGTTVLEYDEEEDATFFNMVRDMDVTEAVYRIEGETIYLLGTEGSSELDPNDDNSYLATGLTAYWSDDDSWSGFMEWNTVLTYTDVPDVTPSVITEQPEGTLVTYNRSGDYIYAYWGYAYPGSQTGKINVVFAEDGKAYIQNPLFYRSSFNSWVEGEYDENTGIITIPTGQYLSWNEDYEYGMQLMWGNTTYEYDEEYGEYSIVGEVDLKTTEIQFKVEDNKIYLLNSSGDITAPEPELFVSTGLYGMWSDDLSWVGDIEFNTLGVIVDLVPAVPANPTADEWYDCGNETGYSKFYFTLPTTDVDGNGIDPEYLSYSIFTDNGNGPELFTFLAEDYTYDLESDLTEVPYSLYTDAVDFHNYYVYMYRTNEEGYEPLFTKNIGIQVFYTVDGVKNSSEIAWLYEIVEPVGKRGDVDGNGDVTIGDVTALIDYLLSGSEEGLNLDNADCNLDEGVTIGDVTALIDYLLSGTWGDEQ